jgi:hypothetical protein
MKKYTRPNMEIAKFSVEDVITSSGLIVSANELTGANAEMYEVYKANSSVANTNVSVFTW